jgi:hypothetical protein
VSSPFLRTHQTRICWLTPYSTVLLEKLTGSQLVNKFPAFYGTPKVHCHTHKCPPPVPIRGFLCEHYVTRYVFLRWGVVSPSPNPPSWRATPCRLSSTVYSVYSQLPSILEAVTPLIWTQLKQKLWAKNIKLKFQKPTAVPNSDSTNMKTEILVILSFRGGRDFTSSDATRAALLDTTKLRPNTRDHIFELPSNWFTIIIKMQMPLTGFSLRLTLIHYMQFRHRSAKCCYGRHYNLIKHSMKFYSWTLRQWLALKYYRT